ncbi:MAG TPA: DNA mismatch repair endonuclease MutL, partial [Candidatus Saccharimonadales bacterium]|nr:DNA mismatch repair endonuclease MutL [Candidatus Saccharimonadales bacterium]
MAPPATHAGRIRVLPAEVVAQIAAGEVIERPLSVLKELLENALDAGATRCEVRLAADPAEGIEVSDDGCGMSAEEVPLALARHATSKLPEGGALHEVRTLGFRGEALPSVAAVARVTLETRSAGAAGAVRARARGTRLELEDCARAPGTTVRVEGLFEDLPPRRKFLRSARSEVRAAVRLLTAYALARPEVAFTLEVDGREQLRWPRADSLAERVAAVFGVEPADGFVPLAGGTPPLTVRGYLGRPERHRSTREEQFFFVNGRWVQNGFLAQALRQGYRSLLPPDRHPAAVVLLDLPGEEVDVNFHPAKREVRFAHESWVWNEVRRAVEQSLAALGRPWAEAAAGGPDLDRLQPGFGAADAGGPAPGASPPGSHPGAPGAYGAHAREGAPPPGGAGPRAWAELYRTSELPLPEAAVGEGIPGEALAEALRGPAATEAPGRAIIGLWQLHRTYILAPIKQGLLVVDQHAAHERILYEDALRRLRGRAEAGQTLLFPLLLELDAAELDTLLDLTPHLEKLGFSFELLSGRSLSVRAIPAGVPRWQDGEALRRLLREGRSFAHDPAGTEGVAEKLARSFACHSAVKAGDPLTPEEMQALIDGLFATSLPHGDVHGRPTLVRLGLDDF